MPRYRRSHGRLTRRSADSCELPPLSRLRTTGCGGCGSVLAKCKLSSGKVCRQVGLQKGSLLEAKAVQPMLLSTQLPNEPSSRRDACELQLVVLTSFKLLVKT